MSEKRQHIEVYKPSNSANHDCTYTQTRQHTTRTLHALHQRISLRQRYIFQGTQENIDNLQAALKRIQDHKKDAEARLAPLDAILADYKNILDRSKSMLEQSAIWDKGLWKQQIRFVEINVENVLDYRRATERSLQDITAREERMRRAIKERDYEAAVSAGPWC